MSKVAFKGSVPLYIETKANAVIMARRDNAFGFHSRKWRKIERLKGVFCFSLDANFRILQFPNGFFEVMPHKLYERQINGRL